MIILADAKTILPAAAFQHFAELRLVATFQITPDALRDVDAVLVRSETRVDRNLLEGTSVRFVGTATIGTDHVDEEYLKERGIGFASAPGSNANSVAEYVVAALLVLAGRHGLSLGGLTLGVVGVGNIGRKVARMAEGLGMSVLLNDPPLSRATSDPKYLLLDDLMDADVISLHVPLTMRGEDATYRFFDANRIGRMKRGSVLLNTARGAVVETEALKEALRSGHLSGAVLDVWENEPVIDGDLLTLVDLATPHIAGYSLDGKANAARMLYDALCAFLRVEARWGKGVMLPPPHSPLIILGASARTIEQRLYSAVQPCYDIEQDDAALRQLLAMPADARPDYFRSLRANYPPRREFFHSRVRLGNKSEELRRVLEVLGFVLDEPSHASPFPVRP